MEIIIHKGKYYLKTETGYREVLAATDETLKLPKPSDSFIRKYIEEYNAGRQIADVLVEYTFAAYQGAKWGEETLYVDKDNNITTVKLKDSYSREEMSEILLKHTLDMFEALSLKPYPKETLMNYTKNYIKEL